MPSRTSLMVLLLMAMSAVVAMGPNPSPGSAAVLPRYEARAVSFEVPRLAMVSDDSDLGLSLTDAEVARMLDVYDDFLFLSDVALINSAEDTTLDFTLSAITSAELLADIEGRQLANQQLVDEEDGAAVVDLMSWSDVYNILGSPDDARLYDCTELTLEFLDGTGSTSFVDREIGFRLVDGRWLIVDETVLDDREGMTCVPGPNRSRARAAVSRLLATGEVFELNPMLEPSVALTALVDERLLAEMEVQRRSLLDDGVVKSPGERQERLMVIGARGRADGSEVVIRACIDHVDGATYASAATGEPVDHRLSRYPGSTSAEEFVVSVTASQTVIIDRYPIVDDC